MDDIFILKRDSICPIGKYREKTFEEISKVDPDYIGWFMRNIHRLPNLGHYFAYDEWFNSFEENFSEKQRLQSYHRSVVSSSDNFKTQWAEDLFGGYSMPDYF